MVAHEVEVGSDISLLEACVQDSEAVGDEFGGELVVVVEVSEDVGDLLQFRGPQGADVADLVEDLGRHCVVLLEDRLGLRGIGCLPAV